MAAIKLYYNIDTFQLITIDDGGITLVQGDEGSKEFNFYFGTGTKLSDYVNDSSILLSHEGRVIIERPDGATSNEIYLTPIGSTLGGYFKLVISSWITDVAGEVKFTTRLKQGESIINFGNAFIPIENGVLPSDETISEAQYDAVLGAVGGVITGETPIVFDSVSGETVPEAITRVDDKADAHIARIDNPHTVTKAQVGLGNVNDTSDLEKPVSTAQGVAIAAVQAEVDAAELRLDSAEGRLDVIEPALVTAELDIDNLEVANMFKSASFNATNGVVTFTRYDDTTVTIDLPTELIVSSGYYDEDTKSIVLVLTTGAEITIPVEDVFTEINADIALKIDKDITGYATVTAENISSSAYLYTYEGGVPKKITIAEIYEGANVAAGAFTPNGVYDDLTVGYANRDLSGNVITTTYATKAELDDVTDGTTDIDYDNATSGLTATTVKGAIDEIDDRIDTLESKIDVVGLDYKEYGVREVVGQSASEFERVTRFGGEIKLGSATGLTASVAIDDADAINSFDFIPIFKREKVSIDATDLSSNTVSNTFVKVPKFYIKEEWTTEGETDYHYIFMSQFKHDGYRLPLPFVRDDGTERDYAYIGAYEAFLDANNKLRSLTGQIPKGSYSRNSFRTAARALDGLGVNSKYQITDLAEYVDLVQIPFMIEFATKHSQGVFLGATSMAYSASHTAIAEGTAVNFIVVSNATGANFVLGQTVSIGTSNSNDSVAKDRIVTQIDVDTPNAGETTITFDGAAVNITIGHVIASRAWKTGMTDNVKVSGSHALNDGKHSIVWRGLENPFGNIWKNVDGVKISNWRGYVTENPKDYNDTASVAGVYAETYLPLGYLNANTNNYAQELGYDANYPYAKFPISVQASSGLFFRDYYYQNSGDRTVFVGGSWVGGSLAGLFYWTLDYALGFTSFAFGARLSYRP